MWTNAFKDQALLLIGGGNMGAALAKGWLARGLAPSQLHIVDPSPGAQASALGAPMSSSVPSALQPRAIVLAIKPQMMEAVLPTLASAINASTLVLSIAAGTTIATISRALGGEVAVVRAMPNTPAAIGAGISAAYGSSSVSDGHRSLADELLRATGKVVWLDTEDQMAAVTALSGSGPGYIFYLLECLTRAGESLGLGGALAHALALETLLGSARLAQESGEDPAVLRRQVTSPNGTTAAGLDVLMGENGLGKLIHHTLDAAAKRARELAG